MSDMTIYEGIHPTLQGELQSQAKEVIGLIRKTSDDLYRIGQILSSVKETLQGKSFSKWCEAEVGIKQATAYRYLSIFEKFSDQREIIGNIDPTALINLAAKSTPQTVLDQVITKAKEGIHVSNKETKDILDDMKARENALLTPPEPEEPPRPQDSFGNEIPPILQRRFQLEENLSAIKLLTAKIQEHAMILRQAGIVKISHQHIIDRAKWIYDEIDTHHPVFICKMCKGEGCTLCKQTGTLKVLST